MEAERNTAWFGIQISDVHPTGAVLSNPDDVREYRVVDLSMIPRIPATWKARVVFDSRRDYPNHQ